MSFVQNHLALLSGQTVSGSNLYSYSPGNGDALADVTTTGYFSQSRFIGQDGWVNGVIFSILADGLFMLEIDATGVTASAYGPGGAQAPVLDRNLHSIVTVDMHASDYTMTDAEAQSGVLILTNEKAGGNKLIWPTTSAGKIPVNQLVYTGNVAEPITMVYDSKPRQDVLVPGYLHQVSIIDTGGAAGAYNLDDYVAQFTSTRINGVITLAAGANNLLALPGFGLGYLLVASDAAPQTLEVDGLPGYLAAAYSNIVFTVTCDGAGGLTLTAAGGASFVGKSPVLASGDTVSVVKVSTGNVWRIF